MWQEPAPVSAAEAVIGNDRLLPARARNERSNAAGGAAHMMGVHHVGAGEGCW